jgi:ABC-type sugar transport system substrate-binding protein
MAEAADGRRATSSRNHPREENDVKRSRKLQTTAIAALALAFGVGSAWAEDAIKLGFVTHAQGNPFIQQIVDGAQAAAKDLGVTLEVSQQAGGTPEGQLKAVQNFVNAGAKGVATSVPGESMAKGLNELIAQGIPIVQYNLLSTAVNAPYVGEKSTQSGRILGKAIVDKLGGASASGTVIIGNCFPGFPVLENRAKGVQESLKAASGLKVLGPFDVKVSEVENYNHWEQLYAANPDAKALIGLCAPDVASLGKLNAANGDKFVAGGYDLTEQNLAAIKGGHAYVTLGQSAFVQGYLPIVLLVNAIKAGKVADVGFYNAGTQIVTADSVDMGNGLPAVSYDEAQKMAADPAATAAYYKAWTQTLTPENLAKAMQPIAAEGE